ncbi:MAG: hypothetical protein CMF49_01440 [Legionellales bacterium]|nr:hypothetical protein [Legionellales bacterium]
MLGTIGLFMPTIVFAVGLGDIRIHSSLNQPLNAQVPVVDIGNVALDNLDAQLASVAQFKLVGLERDPNLSKLRFNILRSSTGQPYVQINSTVPINDPVFTFLVNLTWPNGQMLREYTVFLDPVSYTRKVAVKLKPATSSNVISKQTKASATLSKSTYGPVTQQDDLWAIAKETRKLGTSIQQNMVAIFQKNQAAFAGNNINGLEVGARLKLPTLAEVKSTSTTNAIDFLKQQDKLWREHKKSQTQQPIDTLPEDLQTKNTNAEMLNLAPANLFAQEGDQYENATSNDPSTTRTNKQPNTGQLSQQTLSNANKALAKQMIALQKQLVEKDREILTLEKLLAENKPSPANTNSTQTNQSLVPSTDANETTHSAAQAGEIPIKYGVPWYAFPLLFFIVLISLFAGVIIQKRRMLNHSSEQEAQNLLVEQDGFEEENFKDKIKSVSSDIKLEPRVNKDLQDDINEEQNTHDMSHSLLLAEELINQGLYQKAIERLLTLEKNNGAEFEISIKLLEVFGLAKQKENFKQCYQRLNKESLSSVQKNILESIASLFPEVSSKINQANDEINTETGNDEPTDFHLPDVQSADVGASNNSKDSVPEDIKLSELEKPKDANIEEVDNTIAFEVDDRKYQKPDISSQEKISHAREQEVVDEKVWEDMLDNLSIVEEDEKRSSEDSLSELNVVQHEEDLTQSHNQPSEINTEINEEKTLKNAVISSENDEGSAEYDGTEASQSKLVSDNITDTEEDFETQLDLAKAYIDMGDKQEAYEILKHVLEKGKHTHIEKAQNLLEQIKLP